MGRSVTDKVLAIATVILGALSLLWTASLIGGWFQGGWTVGDWPSGVVTPPAIPLGILGPFAALAGARMLERARAEGRPENTGRILLVGGTLGIATLAAASYWTVLGPVIAVAIALYWLLRLVGWRRQRSPAIR